jgi:glycosyltransferase involved in cell wall biosynthesis
MDVNPVAKKILYITYDGLTDPLGQSQVLPYLQKLSEKGYRFTIISFEKKARFQKDASVIRAIAEANNILWHPLTFTAKPPIFSKIYDRFRMWRTALKLHRQQRFDLIHCRSYVAAEVGLKLKNKYGVKFLFDMRGFWADEKVDNGQWDLQKPWFRKLFRHYKNKEIDFFLNADGIVSLTHAAKHYLKAKPEFHSLSIEVIPCCADLEHFNYKRISLAETTNLKDFLNIPHDGRVLTYLGSVGGWYMVKEMFKFFKVLSSRYPDFYMMILTKDEPEQVKAEAEAAGISPEKIIVTYSDRNRLPAFLAISNYSIFFIRNTFSKMASSPTKHGELMGMGIPVICNSIGDTGDIIRKTKTGILVDNFSEKEFSTAVEEIGGFCADREHIRNCAKVLFDLEGGVNKYFSLYTRIFTPELRAD